MRSEIIILAYLSTFITQHLPNQKLYAQYSILSSCITTESRGLAQTGICNWKPSNGLLNPALLGKTEEPGIGIEVHNYFFVEDLNTFELHGNYRMDKLSGAGLCIATDGSNDFREWLISFSYGRVLASETIIGMSVDYLQLQTRESRGFYSAGFELGFQSEIASDLLAGFVIKNPIALKHSDMSTYPAIFKTGINYRINENSKILIEFQKHGNQQISLHVGIQYNPVLPLSLCFGIQTTGPVYSFGIKMNLKNHINLAMSFEQHVLLGFSPSFGFQHQFQKN